MLATVIAVVSMATAQGTHSPASAIETVTAVGTVVVISMIHAQKVSLEIFH